MRRRVFREITAFARDRIATFAHDGRGSISVEALLILPVVLWAYMAGFVFYDAFRTQNTNVKAAYVVADLIARSTDPVDAAYLEGLGELYAMMSRARHPTAMRVASVDWDITNERYRLRWSYGTGDLPAFSEADLDGFLSDRITDLSAGETALLVETVLDYRPMLEVGVPARTMQNFIQMRPRFVPSVLFRHSDGQMS